MSQFLNLINSIKDGNNLSLLTSLAEPVQDQVKNVLGGSMENLQNASPSTLDNVSSVIEQKAPVLTDSISSVSKTYRWRNIIIIGLIIWAIFMILSRIFIQEEKVQEHIEKTNQLLVGNNGILTLIGYVWVGALVIVTFIPAVLALTPKFETVLSGLGDVIGSLPDTILGLVKK